MDVLALILAVAAMVVFLFAAGGRELRRFNEIAVGLVLLTAALICQFTSITNTHIGRLALVRKCSILAATFYDAGGAVMGSASGSVNRLAARQIKTFWMRVSNDVSGYAEMRMHVDCVL